MHKTTQCQLKAPVWTTATVETSELITVSTRIYISCCSKCHQLWNNRLFSSNKGIGTPSSYTPIIFSPLSAYACALNMEATFSSKKSVISTTIYGMTSHTTEILIVTKLMYFWNHYQIHERPTRHLDWTDGVGFPEGVRFFSTTQRSDRLWSPPNLRSNRCRERFLRE
jgi:hypothetical protein